MSIRCPGALRHGGGEVTEKGLSLLCPGALVHVPGQSGPIALLTPLDSPARSPRCCPLVTEMFQASFRGGEVTERACRALKRLWDGFSRGESGEGPDAHLSWGDALPGGSVPSALLTPLDTPARSLENESRGRVLPFWGRGGDVCGTRCSIRNEVSEGPVDPPRLRFSRAPRGGDREGPVAPLSWGLPPVLGPSCTFLGRAGALPFSRLSTPPLSRLPSKLKVAAERCPSGAEVGTCVAPRNGCRNRSATTSVFEGGGDREGPVAPLSWGPRARSCPERGIALLTRLPRSLFLI